MFYVYIMKDPLNDMKPFYVGKGKGVRWKEHFYPSELKAPTLKNIKIRSIQDTYGPVPVEIYRDGLTQEEAFAVERELISSIGRLDMMKGPLLNKTDGGGGVVGYKHKESFLNMLKERRGLKHPNYKKVFSDETRRRMSVNACRWNKGMVGDKSIAAKTFIIIQPNGEEVVITGLREFCRNNNLHHSPLSCKGYSKGYTLLYPICHKTP